MTLRNCVPILAIQRESYHRDASENYNCEFNVNEGCLLHEPTRLMVLLAG